MRTLTFDEVENASGGGIGRVIQIIIVAGEQLWDFSEGLVEGAKDGWADARKKD